MPNGANEINIKDLDAFLNDDEAGTPPVEEKQETSIDKTKAFANRLKEEVSKERNAIAKKSWL